MSARHTWTADLYMDGRRKQIMVEEFIADDGTRTLSYATRKSSYQVWGPPHKMEQTS